MQEQPGLLVVRVGVQDLAVAIDRLVVLVVVLVKNAEVHEHADVQRRMIEAAFVIADGVVVVAGQVVGMAELKEGAGVAGIQLDGAFQMADGVGALALGQEASWRVWK